MPFPTIIPKYSGSEGAHIYTDMDIQKVQMEPYRAISVRT